MVSGLFHNACVSTRTVMSVWRRPFVADVGALSGDAAPAFGGDAEQLVKGGAGFECGARWIASAYDSLVLVVVGEAGHAEFL